MDLKSAIGQVSGLWTSMSLRQRVSILLAAATVAGGLFYFTNGRTERDFRPLISGMTPEDAGAVLGKLKETGTEYKVGENGTSVLVPSSRVAEVRLLLAGAGLPRTGRIGFELFDRTSIGATDFAEQVNYRRALEGELERSIRSIGEVETARVHLTLGKDSVFLESRLPAKASVLLHLRPGAHLTPLNVRAIVNLVSSAVEGLSPDAVTVTDSGGNLLNRPKKSQDSEQASDEQIEYRQKIERELAGKVSSTLEPLLGAGRFRAAVSVDCDYTSGEQSEELYDPDKSVMLSAQKSEETTGSGGSTTGGIPGTASSLPRPPARTTTAAGGSSRRSENVTYQTSRTVRRTRLPQGNIRRISASVLLDQTVRWDVQNGKQVRVLVPPTPDSIKVIQDVVSAAIGLVSTRGDLLVVQSLPFESTLAAPAPALPVTKQAEKPKADPRWSPDLRDWRLWAGAGGVLVVCAALGVFLRRRKAKQGRKAVMTPALPSRSDEAALLPEPAAAPELAEGSERLLSEAHQRVTQTTSVETLVEELRASIEADPQLAANVLRTWLQEVKA